VFFAFYGEVGNVCTSDTTTTPISLNPIPARKRTHISFSKSSYLDVLKEVREQQQPQQTKMKEGKEEGKRSHPSRKRKEKREKRKTPLKSL